jgi:hypothetical protein
MERINGRDAEASGNWEPGIFFLIFFLVPSYGTAQRAERRSFFQTGARLIFF